MSRKSNYRGIDFDEVVSDSTAPGLSALEEPLRPFVFRAVSLAAILVALVFTVAVILFAGINHDRYLGRAQANANQEVPLISSRGIITDRSGVPLVENQAIFSVFLQVSEMLRNNEREIVLRTAEDVLGLTRDEVLQNMEETDFESIILKRDISREQAIAIETLGLRSLIVENDYRRHYKDPAFSHIVGYVGLVNRDDLRANEKFVLNDLIGRAGIEGYYDGRLRGENGAITAKRNARGEVESVGRTREPISGGELKTTIDADLQKYFHERLLQSLI